VRPDDVAVGTQVSAFVGLVALALEPGTRVVCAEEDFTSLLFPLLAQERRGVRVDLVPLEELASSVGDDAGLVIDAGANIGLSALTFAHRWPAARIVCLEVDDANLELLCRNTAMQPAKPPARCLIGIPAATRAAAIAGAAFPCRAVLGSCSMRAIMPARTATW